MIKVNERNVVKNTMISMLFFFYCDISTATAVMLTLEQNEGTFLQFYNDIYKKKHYKGRGYILFDVICVDVI